MIQPTSLAAYQSEVKPTLGDRQHKVFAVLSRYPDLTNSEIAALLGWQINRVTGRVNELVHKLGLVEEGPKRSCRITGRTAIAWRVKRSSIQQTLV